MAFHFKKDKCIIILFWSEKYMNLLVILSCKRPASVLPFLY